jgi:hypothetical protein
MTRPPRSPTMLAGSVAVSGGGYYGPNWGGVAAGVAVGAGVAAMASSAALHRLPIIRRRLISITHPATNGWHPAESVRTSSLKGSMSRCSRGISYATPMREPTQAECFAYDVWNKSCPGASIRLLTLALGAAGTLVLLSVLAACHKEEKAASQAVRPVRTVTVELHEGGRRYR